MGIACATIVQLGSGEYVFAVTGGCDYVILDAAEINTLGGRLAALETAVNAPSTNVLDIDPAGASLIAAAVLGIWAIGWIFAKLAKSLD